MDRFAEFSLTIVQFISVFEELQRKETELEKKWANSKWRQWPKERASHLI